METTKTKFPPTTKQQRELLFKIWQETGSIKTACEKAHVSRQTFYYWLPRFEAEGYAGLENRSSAPHDPWQTPKEVEERVVKMKEENSEWGKRRIADELAKENSWVPLVSPNTVRRILRDAGLWGEPTEPAKKGAKKASGTPKPPAKP
jgi:transposase